MWNILYFLLAVLGFNLLVVIHEFGHYLMAKRVGMRVLGFSIGFGKPIFKWRRNHVDWMISWIPLGGYVRFAGAEKEDGKEVHEIKDGFFGAHPKNRIKVAFAGPLVNIVFAFLVFSIIWVCGGREKPFHEYTNIIGKMDPGSKLYQEGVRPGDQIVSINGSSYKGFKDLIYNGIVSRSQIKINGNHVNYYTKDLTPYQESVTPYRFPGSLHKDLKTIGVLSPASYLVVAGNQEALKGVNKGDRIIAADGQLVFSPDNLSDIVNSNDATLAIQRDGKTLLVKTPRITIGDLKLSKEELSDFEDWQHASGIKGNLKKLYFLPYQLSPEAKVIRPFYYLGDDLLKHNVYDNISVYAPLKEGDKIVSIDGQKVNSRETLFSLAQVKKVQLVIQKLSEDQKLMSWKRENQGFINSISSDSLKQIQQAIEEGKSSANFGNLALLAPAQPMTLKAYLESKTEGFDFQKQLADQRAKVDKIKDESQKASALEMLSKMENKRVLGLEFSDRTIIYNPNPFVMTKDVLVDSYRTLSGLFTGALKPKWLSGPIGMFQVLHQGWSLGPLEALYWLGMISFGLAIFNLLPIPALDGGHILMALYEWVTKRKISPKTMERLMIPFMILLIGLFIYVTFQDVSRLFQKFF